MSKIIQLHGQRPGSYSFLTVSYNTSRVNRLLTPQRSSMRWKHITLLQSYLWAPPVLYLLPSTNVITYCSGSYVITLYPVCHAVTEVGVHGIWQTHLNMGRVQKQIKGTDSKIPADQVAISISQAVSPICHEAFCCGGAELSNHIKLSLCFNKMSHSLDRATAAGLRLPF